MAYIKLLGGVIVQKQPNPEIGFIEAPDSVVCGMVEQSPGVFVNPTPKTEDVLRGLESAIENHMDEVAQSRQWDNRLTCTLRAGYVNPWQAEGIAFAQWMDNCWAVAIGQQADIIAGLRTIPTEAEAIAELPVMVWP